MTDFSNQLRGWRRANAIKQEALAATLGVSQSAISHWERGKDRPSPIVAARLQDLMAPRHRDPLAIERACLSRQAGLRALYDSDGVRLLAHSQGFARLWPEMSALQGVMLQDAMAGETGDILGDLAFAQQIREGEIVMVSGISDIHVDTAADRSVRFRHRWHVNFRRLGRRDVFDMLYEPCAHDLRPGVESVLRLSDIAD